MCCFAGTCSCFPHSAQKQPWVQIPLSLTANHCPQPLLPLPCCGVTPQGRRSTWTLRVHTWECGVVVSCGETASIRDLGCFCCAAWVSTNNGSCCPTNTGSPLYSKVWIISLVMATPDPLLHCDMEWAGKEHLLDLGWGIPIGSSTKADLFPPCLRGKPTCMCSSWWSPGFYSSPVNPNSPSINKGTLYPQCRTPGLGLQICGSQLLTPQGGWCPTNVHSFLLWVASQGHRSWPPDYMCIFLTALVVQESFCPF